MTEFQNVVAYAVGPKGSGKTRALWDLFISRHPRRLSFDFNGEMHELNPNAIQVFSSFETDPQLEELQRVLKQCAGYQAWHVALVLPPQDLVPNTTERKKFVKRLARILNPAKQSEDHKSFSISCGSIAIDCSEATRLVPNGRAHPDMLGFFQTGRHNWLHLFMASQTPAKVDPEVRNAADFFLAFRTQETTVWKYWADVASPAIADVVAELPRFHCGYFVKAEQRVYVLDDRRRPYRTLDYQGRAVTRGSAA